MELTGECPVELTGECPVARVALTPDTPAADSFLLQKAPEPFAASLHSYSLCVLMPGFCFGSSWAGFLPRAPLRLRRIPARAATNAG